MHSSPRRHPPALVIACVLALGACTSEPEPGGEQVADGGRGSISSPSVVEPPASDPPEGADDRGRPRRDVRVVRDRRDRRTATGKVPAYVEIEQASVTEDAELLFSVRFAGAVPRRSSRGATLRVTFDVLNPAGGKLTLNAQTTRDGWTAASTSNAGEEAPVTLYVGQRSVEIGLDRVHVGPGTLRWLASIAWSKGSSYGFDSAPERGYATFP